MVQYQALAYHTAESLILHIKIYTKYRLLKQILLHVLVYSEIPSDKVNLDSQQDLRKKAGYFIIYFSFIKCTKTLLNRFGYASNDNKY